MKALMIVMLIVGAAYYWQSHKQAQELALLKARNPEVISNPVYAELRVKLDAGSRSFEGVVLAKTVDQADCEQFFQKMEELVFGRQGQKGDPRLSVQSKQCKSYLSDRDAQLFANEPTFVTYVSAARGQQSEREIRWIYWGLTIDESDHACGVVAKMQKGWKGAVKCIRGQRS